MGRIFRPTKYSYYLGEQRPILGIDAQFVPDVPFPTPTPTPSATVTPTPTVTVTPTYTPTLTPTPSSTPPPALDPDASAYLAAVLSAGGSLNATLSAATDTLFVDLKTAGLYSRLLCMYPFLGNTANSMSINAINKLTYQITWNGGWTFDLSGATGDGSTTYGDLGLYADDANLSNTDLCLGVYATKGGAAGNEVDFGGTTAASSYLGGLILPLGTNPAYKVIYDSGLSAYSFVNNLPRYGIMNRISTAKNVYSNGSSVYSTTTDTKTAEHQLQMLGCWYIDGPSPYYISTKRYGFLHIGDGYSPSELTSLSTIVNKFMTSCGKNVY